jgi:SAM-dependent methyltransferase
MAWMGRRRATSAAEDRMRQDWDERARKNAMYFIVTDSAESEEQFAASGEKSVQDILENVTHLLPLKAKRFDTVYGVDVSPEMIDRARVRLSDLGNVKVWCTSGRSLRPVDSGKVDLVISYLVFQHVPEASIVKDLIKDTFRVLKPNGLFKFQVAGRPEGEEAALQEERRLKDTWSGVSFSDSEIRHLAECAGFHVLSTCSVQPNESPTFLWIWVTAQKPSGRT